MPFAINNDALMYPTPATWILLVTGAEASGGAWATDIDHQSYFNVNLLGGWPGGLRLVHP
ncbi:MAG TPA: hypothetical protein VGP72_16355 [Planctomycetota bacterium]